MPTFRTAILDWFRHGLVLIVIFSRCISALGTTILHFLASVTISAHTSRSSNQQNSSDKSNFTKLNSLLGIEESVRLVAVPSTTLKQRRTIFAVFTLISCCLLIPLKQKPIIYDEGLAVFNALRILHGEVPYRDFWTVYTPGQFYVLAGLFHMFGEHLLIVRLYDTALRLVLCIQVYTVLRPFCSVRTSLTASFTVALLLGAYFVYEYGMLPALVLSTTALQLIWYGFITKQRYTILFSGALIGLVVFFRQDVGIYTGITALVLFTLLASIDSINQKSRLLNLLSLNLWLIFSIMSFIFILFLPFIMLSGPKTMYTSLVQFPITTLRSVRGLSYPSLLPNTTEYIGDAVDTYLGISRWFSFYLPIFAYTASFLHMALQIYKASFNTKIFCNNRFILQSIVTIMGVLLINQMLSRYDMSHALPTSICLLILGLIMMRSQQDRLRRTVKSNIFFICATALVALFYLAVPILTHLFYITQLQPLNCPSLVERAECVSIDTDQQAAAMYLTAHTGPAEPVFVGNTRHDSIWINDVFFYYLADRQSATYYHELHPGVATSFDVQQSIVSDLETKQVHWVVLVNIPSSKELNDSAMSSGVKLLDTFLKENYVMVQEYGIYSIWQHV